MSILWTIAQKAERKWWQNYLKKKEVEPYLIWKKNYWSSILQHCQQHFRIDEQASILDAGCGPAGIFINFETQKVDAFDPLIRHYENDLPHFKSANYPNVHFFEAEVESFEQGRQYDYIFCMNAINHVHDIKKGYSNLAQLLKPGAYLVMSIDAHNYNFFKQLFRLLPGDILHPCQHNLAEYRQFIVEQQLEIITEIRLKHEFFFDHYLQIARRPK